MNRAGHLDYKWKSLIVGSGYIGGATIERVSWPLLLPTIRDAFHVPTAEVVWLVVMFALGVAGSTLTVGHLGDKLGHKRLAIIGCTLEGSLLLVNACMPVFWPMLPIRLIQGVGAAMALNNIQALTVSSWAREERGRVLGFISAMPSMGMMIGTLYAGFVADATSWRVAIAGGGLIILSEALFLHLYIRDDEPLKEPVRRVLRNLDWAGSLALVAAIATLILGARFATTASLRPLAGVLLPLAVLGFVMVIVIEKRSSNPVLNLQLFTRRTFAVACSGMVLFSVVAGANTFLFPFYLQKGLLWSIAFSGTVMIALNVVQPVGAPVSGWLADRSGARPVQLAGVAAVVAGLLLSSQLGAGPTTLSVVIVLLVLSLGSSLFNPANNRTIYNEVPPNALATASAISASGRYVGTSLGAALGAALLAGYGDANIPHAFSAIMLVLAALMLVGITLIIVADSVIARTRGRRHPALALEPDPEPAPSLGP